MQPPRFPRLRKVALATALLLATKVVGGCYGVEATRGRVTEPPAIGPDTSLVDFARVPGETVVTLRVRRAFQAPSLAVHPWFVVWDPERQEWEMWDITTRDRPSRWLAEGPVVRAGSDGREPVTDRLENLRYGTIRNVRNLTDLGQWPFRGIPLAEWRGAEADRLLEVLRRPDDYPHRDHYRTWPGPNSNTYAAWVVDRAGLAFDWHPMAVGKDYRGPLGFGAGVTSTGTGLQLETPLVGAKVGLLDGVELHILAVTLGIDLFPPALKTPLGRLGFEE